MCLVQWAKHSRFDETRRARWSRVTFQQACTVVSGNYNHQVAFRHLPASSSSSSILRVRVSSPSSFTIFQQPLLKVLYLRVRVSSPPSFAIFQQHLKVFTLPVRVSTPSSFAIFQQHLAAFECLVTTRSHFVTFELIQNINITCDCTLSNLQINMQTTFMNVNFNKMLEQPYAQYYYSMHIHNQIIKSGHSSSEHCLTITSQKLRANNLIVLVVCLLKFT